MYRETKLVSIPGVPAECSAAMRAFLDSIKQNVEVGLGTREKSNISSDRWLRAGDMSNFEYLRSIGFDYSALKGGDSAYVGDSTPPHPPTGFTVTPGIWANYLSWTNPTDEDFGYIEIFYGTTNNVALASSLMMVHPPNNSFTHYLYAEMSQTFYYWIRSVDFAGNKSAWVGAGDGGGIEVIGDATISITIDAIMEMLRGADPPVYNPATTYFYGNRVLYDSGDGVDRAYICINDNAGAGITGIAPTNKTYWERSGLLVQGDIDGIPTVGIDGNLVVDGTILADAIKTDTLIVGTNISIANGAVHIAHIGTTTDDKKYLRNDYQYWSWIVDNDGNKPADGADVTADQFSQALDMIDQATGRANTAINASYRITKAVQGSIMSALDTPTGAGLWMTQERMGYYNGSSWPVYIKNNGDFWFGKDSYNYFASTLGNLVYSNNQNGAFHILNGGDISFYPHSTNPAVIRFVGDSDMYIAGIDDVSGIISLSIWSEDYGIQNVNFGSKPGDTVWPLGTFNVSVEGSVTLENVDKTGTDTGTLNSQLLLYTTYAQLYGKDYIRFYAPYIRPNSNNATDIGTSTYKFKDLYLSGDIVCDGINATGSLVIENTAPIIDLHDTTANHHWYILNDGDSLQFRYNSLSANRMNLSSDGNLSLDGTITENAWSIDMDRKGERGPADDVWEMARSIRDAFTQHDGRFLHAKLKKESVRADNSIAYGKSPSDLIQVLTECVLDLYEEINNIKPFNPDPK